MGQEGETPTAASCRATRRAVSGVCIGVFGSRRNSSFRLPSSSPEPSPSAFSKCRPLVPACGIIESVGLGSDPVDAPLVMRVLETSCARLRRRLGVRREGKGALPGFARARLVNCEALLWSRQRRRFTGMVIAAVSSTVEGLVGAGWGTRGAAARLRF